MRAGARHCAPASAPRVSRIERIVTLSDHGSIMHPSTERGVVGIFFTRKRDLVDYARRVRVSPDKAARQRSVTGLSAATYRARERISI